MRLRVSGSRVIVSGVNGELGRKYIGCSGHEDAGSNGSGLRVWALCRSMINALSSGSLGGRSPPHVPLYILMNVL